MLRLPRASSYVSIKLSVRTFHASIARQHLVGPPDPVSHLRPVIYDDVPPPPPQSRHPYSLKEFTGDTREYQWKMQRQELDAFNHDFWKECNTRFYAAKEAVLQSLPEGTTQEQREVALSDFYGRWVAQESKRLDEYGEEWRRRNWATILLEARVYYEKLVSRIMHPFR
ncbi:hypothetical protein BD309DRAFT_907097 [Dichomitus squalens]|uniref:Uncharacterized protein n=1 Tax=Dichomitus squalens TaxID=114155 RepID=A0A4Q9QEJ5_9APHY|nr:hypothetical protein BD309DRAFT_907097 [Dichomitus squalens]TBU65780.1 hypothetical protein BD310DRAFT_1034056 [Dichomitus squalens]